jgi:hypothetical protein
MQELSLLATEEVGFFHKQEHFDFGWYVEYDASKWLACVAHHKGQNALCLCSLAEILFVVIFGARGKVVTKCCGLPALHWSCLCNTKTSCYRWRRAAKFPRFVGRGTVES